VSGHARPEPPANEHEGFHFEAVEEGEEWRTPPVGAGRCRYAVNGRKACARPAVATLMRGYPPTVTRAWDYCELHLYGRWIEGGKVMGWRLVKDGGS
jgi:hypothetical protein